MNDYAHHLIKIEQRAKAAHAELEDKRFDSGRKIVTELLIESALLLGSIDSMQQTQAEIESRARQVKS